MRVENGTATIVCPRDDGVVELTARCALGIAPLRMTVDQAMTLGNKLTEAARAVRRAAPVGAKGNE